MIIRAIIEWDELAQAYSGTCTVTIPRHNPVNAYTMAKIVKDAGLTIQAFCKLL